MLAAVQSKGTNHPTTIRGKVTAFWLNEETIAGNLSDPVEVSVER